jgi:hypothetical protein
MKRSCETAIEILPCPQKSYSDCKSYRLCKLPNGFTALLVQHFIIEEAGSNHEQSHRKSESDVSISSATSGDTEEEEEYASGGIETDDEDDVDKHDNGREKMAAVALCIDVGSFDDPPQIQGLSHFLEVTYDDYYYYYDVIPSQKSNIAIIHYFSI